jgi:basic membrane lipoprotein Med (substrate-binding protein (PBP1-ABC) superfamily)/DNA-binding SARP family transcriptional activator
VTARPGSPRLRAELDGRPQTVPGRTAPGHRTLGAEGEFGGRRAERAPGAGGSTVDYAILGSLEVVVDWRALELGPPKQRTLLAVLLLHANQLVTTERLVEFVWGDAPPRTAAHSVQVYVSDLRRRLDDAGAPDVIATRVLGYVLHAADEALDTQRFERLVITGSRLVRAGDADGGAHALEAALRLWRGPALADFAYAEFAQSHIRRLEELRLRAVEELSAARLQLGHAADALSDLSTLLEQHPFRESARELQLHTLYCSGRQADALRTYEAYRRRLADELGVDPSPTLQQLQGRILLQDATLLPHRAAVNGDARARNPFKGLRAFTEADAADFFGRSELVGELCDVLAGGAPLVALVGPSGSGKSSLAAAGLLPALRAGAVDGSDRWRIGAMVPGAAPSREWQVALATASCRGSPSVPVEAAAPPDAALATTDTTLVLIDQFEELFTLADHEEAARFLAVLTDTLRGAAGSVRVVVTLRGDFYDRPLLHAGFADLFTSNVVNVLPLDVEALEDAVTEPARQVGVEVEPALLAELLTDTIGQPGALPLFQYALTELFEHRDGGGITLRCYHELGGLHGALSRRAEGTYADLAPRQRDIAEQVFLRLVSPGEGTADVRRRATATELRGLDLDAVELADLLERFGRHRLLTFDRDPITGDATVEVAHEALLDAWARLRRWIEEHRADLRRNERLAAAVAEWDASGSDDDYLLTGGRLDQYLDWQERTSLRLTRDAQTYLAASRHRRDDEVAQETARRAHEAGLRRRARTRLFALFATVSLLAAVTTALALAMQGARPPDVAVVTDGTTTAIGPPINAGAQRAAKDLELRVETTGPVNDGTLESAVDRGAPLIIHHPGDLTYNPSEHPDRRFVLIDYPGPHAPQDNLTYANFAEHEGSFLVGAAAALTSETGRIGFIGGVDDALTWRFQAGFEAGARQVDPAIEVDSVYLTRWPDDSGWGSPTLGAQAATDLYRAGADVVYHAAGTSGWGLFETVVAESRRQGRHLWAIGVDSDAYLDDRPARLWQYGPKDWQPHILTSMLKRYDTAVYAIIADHQRGALTPGDRVFDLANGGVEYATSGGFIDEHIPVLEGLRRDIVAGRIVVPTVPD